jgi:hypothetical protein
MKNINLILILALLISIQLFSQDNNTKRIRLGVNVGTNSFDLNKDDFFDKYEKKIGYSFGVSLEYIINEKISVITNLNFDRKIMQLENFRYREIDGNDYTATDKLKFSYLNIPLILRYYVVNKAFINLGGFYNHSLNIENDTSVNETGESTTLFQHENIIEKYDYGISFGLGYKFKLNEKNYLTLELRDDLGLANIAMPSTIKLKTNTIKLLLNWELPI